MRRLFLSFLFLGVSGTLAADSISPASYSATLGVGESATVHKTVTVDAGLPTSAKVDVFFLTDSTGSMGGLISSVKASASTILSTTASLGDVAFGVGEYRDIFDAFTFRINQDITTNQALAQAGINAWFAGGGGDFPEANLPALERTANQASWRPGSKRIVVWFGDAPGHDPRAGSTEASATAALQAKNITVHALDLRSLNSTGQASRITAATGGTLFTGVNTSNVVAKIQEAISASFATYSSVALDLSGVPAGVSASAVPASHTGSFDRSVARSFDFDVTFTGVTPGIYSFSIGALVDGGLVASESDRITVTGDGGGGETPIPEPTALLLLGAGAAGLGLSRRRRKA